MHLRVYIYIYIYICIYVYIYVCVYVCVRMCACLRSPSASSRQTKELFGVDCIDVHLPHASNTPIHETDAKPLGASWRPPGGLLRAFWPVLETLDGGRERGKPFPRALETGDSGNRRKTNHLGQRRPEAWWNSAAG